MEKNTKHPKSVNAAEASVASGPSLDHGVQSLIAKDNPDDVDMETAVQAQKRGSRR